MDTKQKILVCGDVGGKFKTLFNRVKTVNDKSGPFDFLFCVGDFFGDSINEWLPYQNGTLQVPVPTYFLGPTEEEHVRYYTDLNGCEMCPNVNYLGRRGLLTSSGLKIAYLSGKEGSSLTNTTFTDMDTNAVRSVALKSSAGSDFLGVDILLSSVWPKDVTRNHENCPVREPRLFESSELAKLANTIRPRYHFAAKENIYYERPPYENHCQTDERNSHCTRFLALGKVGGKEKWLYAASITPIADMKALDLYQVTTDQTPCPYSDENSSRGNQGKQFFYDMSASYDDTKKGVKRTHDGEQRRQKIDQDTCWFCLSSPSVEKHLVVSVGNQAYLAMAKGGINEFHVMILPVQHHRSLAYLADEISDELRKFREALKKMFKKMKMVPVVFERNFKTSHMQVHVIPVPKSKASKLKDAFLSASEELGLDLSEIPPHSQLSSIVPMDTPYFYLELPTSERLFASCKKNFPLEFARDVLAGEDILDVPHRVNWRDCILTKPEETKIVGAFREAFRAFDFTED